METPNELLPNSQRPDCHMCGTKNDEVRLVTLAVIQTENNSHLAHFVGKHLCRTHKVLVMAGGDLTYKRIPLGHFRVRRYQGNKRICLSGHTHEGEEVVRFTTNIPGEKLHQPNREVFLKSWSENEGLYQWMLGRCLVEPTDVWVPAGHTVAPLVRLTDRAMSLFELTDEDLAETL